MKYTNTSTFLILALLLVSACGNITGDELARIKVREISTAQKYVIEEADLSLLAGDKLKIWSEMNLEYEDQLGLQFQVEVLKDGEIYRAIPINPFEGNVTTNQVKTTIKGKTKWKFKKKNTILGIEEDGNYVFRVALVATNNPSLQLNQADLVIKQ